MVEKFVQRPVLLTVVFSGAVVAIVLMLTQIGLMAS